MMDDFILRALLAGSAVALLAGPLGCLMIWKRMVYFGAAISHSSLLGIALGLLLGLGTTTSLLISVLVMTVLLYQLDRTNWLSRDTLLGIIAHGALAAGLVIIATTQTIRIDLMSYLFGDILSVSQDDLWLILAVSVAILVILQRIWLPVISATLNVELAAVEGVAIKRNELLYMLLLALTIALGMKIVGIMLVVSLLIIPAAVARQISHSPGQMAIIASIVGIISVASGMYVSVTLDWPSGPAIVLMAALLFIVFFIYSRLTHR